MTLSREQLTNTVGVTSKPEHGENVTSSATADVVSQISGMTVEKTAIPDDGYRGTVVTFPINITNNETVKLAHVKAVDVLPLGMDYEPERQHTVSNQRSSDRGKMGCDLE